MLESLTIGLRGLALGFVIALALGTLGLAGRRRLAFWALLGCIGAYLVRAAPEAAAFPVPVRLPLSVAAVLFPAALWWLVHTVFDDRADVPPVIWLAMAGLLAVVATPPTAPGWLSVGVETGQKLVGLVLVGAALWRLWRGRAGDLVPGRRVLRGGMLGYAAVHGLGVLAVELWLAGRRPPEWLDLANVALIAVVLAVSLGLLLRVRHQAVDALFDAPIAAPTGEPAAQADPAASTHDAAAERAVARLERLMRTERAYRSPDLTVASLAQGCGVPEYRLRDLIHRRLGYRNFAAFVNDHRLQEVERRLRDPADDRLPILTLALDAGFGSIGPFNRLFRERHAMTPSAYRQRCEPGREPVALESETHSA
jgi:AraC-like DNA-binding protein